MNSLELTKQEILNQEDELEEILGFDIGNLKKQTHKFEQFGNRLVCMKAGHHHASFLPDGKVLSNKELDDLNR